MISILGTVSEMNRVQIRENQMSGIRVAKMKGIYKGRKAGSAEDTLKFLSKPQNKKALELLKRFKLDEKKDDFAASLSGGQRKLLEMARALMTDPVLFMLDEPMAGVNPALTQSLLDHVLNLKKDGMTVLFVEHDMHMVRHIADWVVVMAEGRVVAEGPPEQVMKDPAVIDAYLGSHQHSDLGTMTCLITLPKGKK
jgi:branched-chain amino acid transport system ATP-binding protein